MSDVGTFVSGLAIGISVAVLLLRGACGPRRGGYQPIDDGRPLGRPPTSGSGVSYRGSVEAPPPLPPGSPPPPAPSR